MEGVIRLLELARRELCATDSFLRIGGESPTDERCVEHPLRPGCHWVVTMPQAPTDRAAIAQRMAELAKAFDGTVGEALAEVEHLGLSNVPGDPQALGRVLAALRDTTGALAALVIDRQSPMVWGSSEPELGLTDQPRLIEVAEVLMRPSVPSAQEFAKTEPPRGPEPAELARARRALRDAAQGREHGPRDLAVIGRALLRLRDWASADAFAPQGDQPGAAFKEIIGLYRVVLVFEQPFSPLKIEGVLRRAAPIIERHIVELPPLEPTPKGARVLPLRRD